MSFLLEALRKTESQKHLGDVPTIHSAPHTPGRLPRKYNFWPVLLVLLPAFLVLLWFGSRQFAGVEESAEGSRLAAPKTPPAEPAGTPNPVAAAESVPDLSPATVLAPVVEAPRTPVEDYTPPAAVAGIEVQEPPSRREVSGLPSAKDAAGIEAHADPGVKREADATVASASEPRPYRPLRAGTIGYWRLPESVRADLPEFRISVLVYSEDPEDRFILLNGKRQLEGDSYQPGLVLEEIRRDGAVFNFRRYTFLVSR